MAGTALRKRLSLSTSNAPKPQQENASFLGKAQPGRLARSSSFFQTTAQQPAQAAAAAEEPRFNFDQIYKIACSHDEFSTPAVLPLTTVHDMPNLYDLLRYEVDEEQQKRLWKAEIRRLIATMESPLEFTAASATLQRVSRGAYEALADLADQIWSVLNIIELDVQCVMAENYPPLFNRNSFQKAHRVLDYLQESDEDQNRDNENKNNSEALRATPDDLFHLVNYMTEVMARVLCGSAHGDLWHNHVIAGLAQIATKVKILSRKPAEFAQRSMIEASGIDVHVPDRDRNPVHQQGRSGSGGGDERPGDQPGSHPTLDAILPSLVSGRRDGDKSSKPASRAEETRDMYFLSLSRFQISLMEVFKSVVVPLRDVPRANKMPVTSYELCAVVYETGFDRCRTLLFQDEDGEFLGTSNPDNVAISSPVFEILHQTIKQIKRHAPPDRKKNESRLSVVVEGESAEGEKEEERNRDELIETTISWSYSSNNFANSAPEKLQLQSMSAVIMLMVPFHLVRPKAVDMIKDFIAMIILTEVTHNAIVPCPQSRFHAFFTLTTGEYAKNYQKYATHTASPLAKAAMKVSGLVSSATGDPKLALAASAKDPTPTQGLVMPSERTIKEADAQMHNWVFEEKGVVVKCEAYVLSVMFICGSLVCGGIAIGLTVNDRIPAVDPFNLTSYCWVFAAFVLLVAKSIRVRDWPWRDFLYRRVVCRSVSELSVVTGVDEQLIVAKVLEEEAYTLLETRGPYNCVFDRRSDDGFSIDVPITLETMLFIGLVMVQVRSPRGNSLVCLDVRRNTEYAWIPQRNIASRDREYITSDKMPDGADQAGGIQGYVLKRDKLEWAHIIGIYSGSGVFM
ncbi:hypothetical protein BDW69DRAFT_177416 [Aspergillus filifer]